MKPLTKRGRLAYKLAILVCVIDMGIIAHAIHVHDDWFSRGSMAACVLIAGVISYRLRPVGVEA